MQIIPRYRLLVLVVFAALLTACGKREERATEAVDTTQLSHNIAMQPVSIEYEKRISPTETIRGIGIPYAGNIFSGKPDDVRCLLYTNEAYKSAQIICPDSSERYPHDVVEETGTPDPIN